MTIIEIRQFLFPSVASRFSLPLAHIKDRLGEPASIRFFPSVLQRDQKNIVVFSYRADDGAVDLYCPVVLRDNAEWAVDGWIIVEQSVAGIGGKSVGSMLVKELFDDVKPLPSKTAGPEWRSGRQLSLGDDGADADKQLS